MNNEVIIEGIFGKINVSGLLKFIVENELNGKMELTKNSYIIFEKGEPIYAKANFLRGKEALENIMKKNLNSFTLNSSYRKGYRNLSIDGEKLLKLRAKFFPKERKKERKKKRKIESSNEMLNFYSNLIHKMSNPLTIIRGSIQLLIRQMKQEIKISENLKDNIKIVEKKITKQVKRLSNLLASTRKISKARGRKDVIFDIITLIKNWVEVEKKSFESNINFYFHSLLEKATLFGDPDEIIQVLSNIIDNSIQACKLSEKEKNEIYIFIEKKNNNLVIYIRDNGIGIKKENSDKIFEPFYSSFPEGGGLGLSVVRAILINMNSEILIKGKYLEGTEVVLTIPLEE